MVSVIEYILIEKDAPEIQSDPNAYEVKEVEYPVAVYRKLSPRTASPREESAFERYLRLKKQALLDRNHSLLQMIDPV